MRLRPVECLQPMEYGGTTCYLQSFTAVALGLDWTWKRRVCMSHEGTSPPTALGGPETSTSHCHYFLHNTSSGGSLVCARAMTDCSARCRLSLSITAPFCSLFFLLLLLPLLLLSPPIPPIPPPTLPFPALPHHHHTTTSSKHPCISQKKTTTCKPDKSLAKALAPQTGRSGLFHPDSPAKALKAYWAPLHRACTLRMIHFCEPIPLSLHSAPLPLPSSARVARFL